MDLKVLAYTALQQINEKNYDTEMLTKGVNIIFKFGVAFSGKKSKLQLRTKVCKKLEKHRIFLTPI